MTPPRERMPWFLVGALMALALCSFTMSFGALSAFAERAKAPFPQLWPVMLDGAIIVIGRAGFVCAVARRPHAGYQWLVVLLTALSCLFNVAHFWPCPALDAVLHASPPVMMFLLSEVMLRAVRHATEDASTTERATATLDGDNVGATTATIRSATGDNRDSEEPSTRATRRQKARDIARDIVRREGKSKRTLQRHRAAARKAAEQMAAAERGAAANA